MKFFVAWDGNLLQPIKNALWELPLNPQDELLCPLTLGKVLPYAIHNTDFCAVLRYKIGTPSEVIAS